MAMDRELARAALEASGMTGRALWFLLLPFGRERRVLAALRTRQSVLEGKNGVLDTLARAQQPLVALGLDTAEEVALAMTDPDKRRLVQSLGMSREVLQDEANRWGTEVGGNFEQALSELQAEGRVLSVPGPAGEDVYLIAPRFLRQRYDLTPLRRVLKRGKEFGATLRTREKSGSDTDRGRTYRM